ncbi:MAG: aromatic amino acid lyase [Gemmatimonadales bacterium]|nr:aromatic amino acid lyase [Gemmatimonadales bacterium]
MSAPLRLDGASLALADVVGIARDPARRVTLDPGAVAALAASRARVDAAVARGEVLYGINTGFGKLATVRIPPGRLDELQVNLLRSHAAGVGDPLPRDVVRALLLLRANVLLRPTSGVRPALVEALLARLNEDRLPVVPEQGSVGASGDLAPLAHVALALLEEDGVAFAPKEGLAFINGTQAQTALLALLVHDADTCWRSAVAAAAMSHEALRATPVALDPRIHAARPHAGQREAADAMRALLDASEIRESHREGDERVQDAYSLRCAPQVLGAVRDAIRFAEATCLVELNASTDNPLVFAGPDGAGEILSGGNFHGQPVAQALDVLAIALTTLQAIAERRVERLVNPDLSHGLPAFLTAEPGVASGYMMVQITAASLVAESRALCHPASIGSIPTDANQEDFVPMGMAAAYKCRRILANAARVVAAEFLCAAQGLEFLRPLRPGLGVAALHARIRGEVGVPPLGADRPPTPDLERLAAAVLRGRLAPVAAPFGGTYLA